MSSSVLSRGFKCRVSSVLNKDTKQFGKEKMFDGTEETCWNSHQGLPQFIVLVFDAPVNIEELQIMFQGGFVGKFGQVFVSHEGDKYSETIPFLPQDSNSLQSFAVKSDNVTQIKIEFKESSDFFGRVTIYKLDVLGTFPYPR